MTRSLSPIDLRRLEERLGGLRTSLLVDLERLERDAFGEPEERARPQGDEGQALEQEVDLELLTQVERILRDVTDALERIRAGSFGTCEDCCRPIPRNRLMAIPYARTCIGCARKRPEPEPVLEEVRWT